MLKALLFSFSEFFSSNGDKEKSETPAPEIEGLVANSGLSPLIACSLNTSDRGLMLAFMERWHKETSSFHLPIREVTITLDDVVLLLHLPIIGAFHSFEQLHVDDVVDMLVKLLEVIIVEVRTEMIQCHGSYVRLSWLRDICTLFANKSDTHVHVCWIYEHFPSVGSALVVEDYDKRRPCACQWTSGKALPVSTYRRRLDRLTPNVVC
ncbi:Protein MAIN-LIKE 1 [Glycine soja]